MVNLFPEPQKVFYHGSCTAAGIKSMLLPPEASGTLSEKGRNKNLNRVFFTEDIGLAKVYAGRASKSIGGEPVLFRVVAPVDVVCMNDTKGASVYHAAWAFVEQIQ
ncbi:putative ADP-ribosyl transferase [Acinetobacter phage vB_AbaM_Konradin]|uniref:Putative ADP-ribosyl transferase n=1 Tax=Acinetobacter phage vB_AbaM_Konradin TaxID=2666257 RepID=A0A650EUZ4_9CAUD|nr:putative ADP-ribosyl transferase [Acinetobacter phage vB_AbaM_Konradin]QGT53824.1 putative ADP-ribosyl transferase [Acinetobacter phage vB_AbaM_Konradin]